MNDIGPLEHECVRQEYLKHLGQRCPFCKSERITATESIQVDGDCGTQTIYCYTCEKSWVDIYRLADVDLEQPPED